MADHGSAVIVGVGPKLGAAVGRRFAEAGLKVALAARNTEKLAALVDEIAVAGGNARAYPVDAANEADMVELFASVERDLGPLEVAVYNAGSRVKGSILELEADQVERAWRVGCLGGLVTGREAARRMVPRGSGTILFTGATASVKGFARSAGFAINKFGLRALAQCMARELAPQGVHVAHVVIDGGIGEDDGAERLAPAAIAETYYQLHTQPKSIWAWEIELRPWVESF